MYWYSYKMEKLYLVHALNLPKDTVDCICSFLFCTLQQCIERNKKKYKTLISDIQEIKTNYVKMYSSESFIYYMSILYPIRDHKAIHTMICNDCGNFINIFNSTRKFGCKC